MGTSIVFIMRAFKNAIANPQGLHALRVGGLAAYCSDTHGLTGLFTLYYAVNDTVWCNGRCAV